MSSFGKAESLKENCNKFVRGKGKIFSSKDTVMNVKLHSIQWRKQLCETKTPFSEYVENQALLEINEKKAESPSGTRTKT